MRGCGHIDVELTKLRRELGIYQDAASYVSTDSREYVFGEDKKRRYREAWERDERRCRTCGKLVSFEEMQPDHVKERSKGGDDSLDNIHTLCYEHHVSGPDAKHA